MTVFSKPVVLAVLHGVAIGCGEKRRGTDRDRISPDGTGKKVPKLRNLSFSRSWTLNYDEAPFAIVLSPVEVGVPSVTVEQPLHAGRCSFLRVRASRAAETAADPGW